MITKALQRIASMNDVTKSYFVGLEESVAEAFLAKSAADQDSEATTAAEVNKKAAEEAERAKSGKTARESELEKRLDGQASEIEVLKAKLGDADVEKRANTEFDGYPGGAAVVVPLLKAYAKLPEADRIAAENVLKAHRDLAKSMVGTIGLTEEEVAKAMPATVELAKKAADLAKSEGITLDAAKAAIFEDPIHGDLASRVLAEELRH